MVHELKEFDRAHARQKHPGAAIIRHELGVTYVFDRADEAIGHKTARIDPTYRRVA